MEEVKTGKTFCVIGNTFYEISITGIYRILPDDTGLNLLQHVKSIYDRLKQVLKSSK